MIPNHINRIMKQHAGLLAATVAALALTACSGRSADEFAYLYKDLPFEMAEVSRPSIPDYNVSLLDFGGCGDGVTHNTQAFADAVEHLSAHGGGHLVVPAGIFYTGPIELKSCIDLHVTPQAVIVFDPDRDLYPVIDAVFEGLDTKRCESPIHAEGVHDISITGGGVIDGSGHAWRALKRKKVAPELWKKMTSGHGFYLEEKDMWYPDSAYYEAAVVSDMNTPPKYMSEEQLEKYKSFLRPVMVSLRRCENVLLEDCVFQNSPAWNIHPLLCGNVIVKDVTVRNASYAQNGDGIDVDSCHDVVIVGSSFDVGDDGVCIKSGKDKDGRDRGVPSKGIIVDGCTVFHGHGGFVVGSEMSGGVENIKVSNCRFLGTDVGLRFKSCRGRGGVVRNIFIDNIYMTDMATEALLFDLFYNGTSAVDSFGNGAKTLGIPEMPVDETTPQFRDINISNIVCSGAARAMYFNGLPEMPVSGISISDCTISSKVGIVIRRAEDVTLSNVKVSQTEGEPIVTVDVNNLKVE